MNRYLNNGVLQRYTLRERDIKTLRVETDTDNGFVFSESDVSPVLALRKFVQQDAVLLEGDGARELAELIGFAELSQVLDGYLENRPVLLSGRGMENRFRHLYSRGHMKAALNAGAVEPDDMKLVTATGEFCTQPFLERQPRSSKRLGERVIGFVEKRGGTFNVSRIYKHSEEVAGLALLMNRLFKARISASAFFTGPNAQAFPLHWDTFDTLIFQVEGTKHWKVYELMIREPLAETHYCYRYDLRKLKPMFEVDLAEGDLMVLPRGYAHVARTGRSNSIHLTVGIHTPSWRDFFLTIMNRTLVEIRSLENFRSDCHLCQAPRELRRKHANLMLDHFVNVARSVIESDYFLDHCVVNVGMKSSTTPDRQRLNENSVLVRRAGFFFLDKIDGALHFRCNDTRLVLPAHVSDTLEFMAKTTRFRVRDAPDSLTIRSRKLLATKLCEIGFLTIEPQRGRRRVSVSRQSPQCGRLPHSVAAI